MNEAVSHLLALSVMCCYFHMMLLACFKGCCSVTEEASVPLFAADIYQLRHLRAFGHHAVQ